MKKIMTTESKKPDFQEVPVTKSEDKPKKKIGRPRKMHDYTMQNGIIDAKRLFLYVPVNTLDTADVDRFLELCDRLFIELGPKVVTEIDIKDVATLFRDTIVRDKIYEGLKECAQAPDKSLMLDLNKISGQIDTLQKSLKVRAADREKERTNSKDLTMIDIIDKFKEDEDLFALFDVQQKQILDKYYNSPHTEVDEYMSIRAANSIKAERTETEEDSS